MSEVTVSSYVICTADRAIGGFRVKIKGINIYVFPYESGGKFGEHLSYHETGRQHFKRNGGDYRFYWRSGPSQGRPVIWQEPRPSEVEGRQQIGGFSWPVRRVLEVSPFEIEGIKDPEVILVPPDFTFDQVIVLFSVVSPECEQREYVDGRKVFWRKRLEGAVVVEIEASDLHIPVSRNAEAD